MDTAQVRTVADWREEGYRGLRIMRCPECRIATSWSWERLNAGPDEDLIEVARRVRCDHCERAPAGLAVHTYRDAA